MESEFPRPKLLPFLAEDFFAVFADYNESVWPMQWLLHAVAAGILLLPVSRLAWGDRIACGLLAVLWAWMAFAYHLAHFAAISSAALLFGAAFLVQAGLFIWRMIAGCPLQMSYRRGIRSTVGVGMVTYALLIYPLFNALIGQSYPATPTFGVPCPTTIFTLGVLMLARAPKVGILFVVPLLWSAIGGSATFLLGVWSDLGLLVSGAIVILWVAQGIWQARRGAAK